MGGGIEDCPECDGSGRTDRTNCCGAHFYGPGYPDSDICVQCKEHARPEDCNECDGTGHIDTAARKAEAKSEAEIERFEDKKNGQT